MHTLLPHIAGLTGADQENIRVLSSRADRIVAHVVHDGLDMLVKVDQTPSMFGREAAAMQRLRALGLPISDVLELHDGPPSALIASWAEGSPIAASSPTCVIARLGHLLRAIHSEGAEPPFSGHPSIDVWIRSWLHELSRWWIDSGHAAVSAQSALETWLDDVTELLAGRTGCLILFDGRPEHILVDTSGELHVIDVADLMAGDPAMDLAVLELEAPGMLDALMAGYKPTQEASDAFGRLVPLYAFLRALAAAEWHTRVTQNPQESRRYLSAAERLWMLNQPQPCQTGLPA